VKERFLDNCFVPRKQKLSNSIKTGLLACPPPATPSHSFNSFSFLKLYTKQWPFATGFLAELTVARQPMIFTWFPIKPVLPGILMSIKM
jgi:3-hydroxymyristoyl/3-hydroxydecanoyl-(acyl carrier protein) dehydratase